MMYYLIICIKSCLHNPIFLKTSPFFFGGARETNAHLMRCPDEDRTRLLIKSVAELEKWIEIDGRTDPELISWIPKYILMQNNTQFTQLGYISK